jgi:hypothetical protein
VYEEAEPQGADNVPKFAIMDSQLIPSITLPARPDELIWRRLLAAPSTADEDIGDPFGPIVWQAAVTLAPSVDAVVAQRRGEVRLDDILRIGLSVLSLRTEIRSKVWQSAERLRDYARQILTQSGDDLNSIRFGHFVVAEPVVVEKSAVNDGDKVKSGDSIAIVRPISRYAFSFRTELSSGPWAYLLPGTSLEMRFVCGGPLPASRQQKAAVLSSDDKSLLISWLASIRREYFEHTSFVAKLDTIERFQYYATKDDRAENVAISLTVGIPSVSLNVRLQPGLMIDQRYHF